MAMPPTTDAIWSHLSSDLWRFIRRRVPEDHVADDLLQEAFLRVHRSLGTLAEAERVAAWVYQIARNVVRDHHRKASHSIADRADLETLIADDQEPRGGCSGGEWLEGMIESLPSRYRQAVRMAEVEECSQQAIADRLRLSLSGAKSRVQRGRAMLEELLRRGCSVEIDVRGRVRGCDPKPDQNVCKSCGDQLD
jgi:RNA polymerase sigma-70 factor (ECF subfamily)